MKTPTILIAEAGVNHGGDFEVACRLIREARKAGADYVKFQTFSADKLVCSSAPRAEYQERNCGGSESQLDMLRRLELAQEAFPRLARVCADEGIGFLSSPFDIESIIALAPLGMDFWKIPSGEITNLPYLETIAAQGGRVILSTGMSTLQEIGEAIAVLERGGTPRKNITLLHCNTQYPTPPADVNLLAMNSLRQFGCGAVGFSDHTVGINIPVGAVALGASVIEKHFTLDKNAAGPDHRASADPEELAQMVSAIREVETALGSPEKHVTESERPNIAVARKSIVASRHIAKGEPFSPLNITTKRPGTGLSPMLWHYVIGRPAPRDFLPDEPISR